METLKKFENESNELRLSYEKLCLDLNMDKETSLDGWNSYENLRHHYVFQGDQLHWLAVSLYICCRRNDLSRKCDNNPISIDRLLKSANNLSLIEFFDKLHKWEDMNNLPDEIRNKLDQVEKSFHLSSCLFDKYPKMFHEIFGRNENKYLSNDYLNERKFSQINPKVNHRNRSKKCSQDEFYSFGWTLFSLSKTIYPSISNDLLSSFHLLISTFQYLYQFLIRFKQDHLLQGQKLINALVNDHRKNSSINNLDDQSNSHLDLHYQQDNLKIIEILCQSYGGNIEMCCTIYQEYYENDFFEKNFFEKSFDEENPMKIIREINRYYDEIVLRNCIIDERIFLDQKYFLNDFCNSLNENRNQKTFENRTPLTANEHLQNDSSIEQDYLTTRIHQNQCLTPISQVNLLIQQLDSIIGDHQLIIPSKILHDLIQEQTFLDHLIQRIEEWKQIYNNHYDFIEIHIERKFHSSSNFQTNSSERYFQKALKLFYRALEKILLIEKKRLIHSFEQEKQTSNENQQIFIQKSFQKLILNNEFLKSLLGLSLLLVFFAHGDNSHDFQWIFTIYDLHGYSFLKMIQIFLKTLKEFHQTRSFIKYLSKIEETILSSMVWSKQSSFWIDLKRKGFLQYEQIFPQIINSTPTNLTHFYIESPSKSIQQVSRKLFNQEHCSSSQTLIRYQSDPIQENSSIIKCSPYTMFYRKFYELVLCRLDLLSLRIYGNQYHHHEQIIWNLFLFLFQNYTETLFSSRHLDQILLSTIYFYSNTNLNLNLFSNRIPLSWTRLIQAYKTIPNSHLKVLRSVYLTDQSIDQYFFSQQKQFSTIDNPCLTPSKPAGTIHLINGQFIGDIMSFYKEIFMNLNNFEENLINYFQEHSLRNLPQRKKLIQNASNDQLTINLSTTFSLNYSTTQINSDHSLNSTLIKSTNDQINQKNQLFKQSINTLSSTIPAGHHNTVQTTRTRTRDGKFLTTISTISTLNGKSTSNNDQFLSLNDDNHVQLNFGQSSTIPLRTSPLIENSPIKRTLSNSSSLNSFKKKILLIENDRQNHSDVNNQSTQN